MDPKSVNDTGAVSTEKPAVTDAFRQMIAPVKYLLV